MTLHAAKGLEFETVFLPGWEEGLFPHQRSLDEQGRAGLEEERRLAYVGLTRAKRRAKIYFATNRRIRGLWQTTIPSRFLDELPAGACRGCRCGVRRAATAIMRNRASPIWTPTARPIRRPAGSARSAAMPRSKARRRPVRRAGLGATAAARRGPLTIEGELVAKSSAGIRLRQRRAGVSHQIRAGHGRRRRWQQAHRRFRQGRPQDGAGKFCPGGVRPKFRGLLFFANDLFRLAGDARRRAADAPVRAAQADTAAIRPFETLRMRGAIGEHRDIRRHLASRAPVLKRHRRRLLICRGRGGRQREAQSESEDDVREKICIDRS